MKKNLFITCSLIILLLFSWCAVNAEETKGQTKEQTKKETEEQKKQKKAEKAELEKQQKAQKEEEKKQAKEKKKQQKADQKAKQEEKQPEKERFFISLEDWYAKSSNADNKISTRFDSSVQESTNLLTPSTSGDSPRFILGWILKKDLGTIELSYWGFSNDDRIIKTDPGNFIFSQNLSFPLYAGVFDDGLADGVVGSSNYSARSFSLLYSRPFTKSERLISHWKMGLRKVTYNHKLKTEYLCLLPELIDPFPPAELVPKNDYVRELSELEARGIETGLSIIFPISKRVTLGSDVGVSLLSGRSNIHYTSNNYYYTLGGSYFNPQDERIVPNNIQQALIVSSQDTSVDSLIQIIDAKLKLTWNVWRTIDLTIGYAASFWNGALGREELDRTETSPSNHSQTSRLVRSNIAFDGFFMGFTYRY